MYLHTRQICVAFFVFNHYAELNRMFCFIILVCLLDLTSGNDYYYYYYSQNSLKVRYVVCSCQRGSYLSFNVSYKFRTNLQANESKFLSHEKLSVDFKIKVTVFYEMKLHKLKTINNIINS